MRRIGDVGSAEGRSALDVASGDGRHALALARRGYAVTAWDVSDVALDALRAHADAAGLQVATRLVDLTVTVPAHAADLVVVVDFLDRGLLSRLSHLLAPGGTALVSTFTADWPGEHPSPRFRLDRGELSRGLPGLDTVDHREEGGRAVLVARRGG